MLLCQAPAFQEWGQVLPLFKLEQITLLRHRYLEKFAYAVLQKNRLYWLESELLQLNDIALRIKPDYYLSSLLTWLREDDLSQASRYLHKVFLVLTIIL